MPRHVSYGFVVRTQWPPSLLTLFVRYLRQWYVQKIAFKFHNATAAAADNLVSTYSLLFLNKEEMWAALSQHQMANFKLYYTFGF